MLGPGRCHCGLRAVAVCMWPVERFARTTYGCLQVGDRVKRATGGSKDRPPATVMHVAKWSGSSDGTGPYGLQIELKIGTRVKEIIVLRESRVMVARMGPCLATVCENHLRRVWDGVEYCQSHWGAWETASILAGGLDADPS